MSLGRLLPRPHTLWGRLRRATAGISVRLLAFNLLLVFLPVAGVLYLGIFEEQLLSAQEQSMVQQGRLLAAALAGRAELSDADPELILLRLGQRSTARLRVYDERGQLLADSSRLGPRRESGEEAPPEPPTARTSWLYRLGAGLFALASRLFDPGSWLAPAVTPAVEPYAEPASERPAVVAALAGRYGAATAPTPGQRSVTLHSAIPILDGERVVGVVLVSQSTLRLLRDLYDVRLAVFRVFLASLAAAVVLTLVLSTTIARPLKRLRREASELLDRRGRLKGRFTGSRRLDELGDLARALAELSRRLEDRIRFTESFSADVSHEFKNPLASIRLATEMLAEAEGAEDRARFLRLVEGDVERLERLLSSVREVSEIDSRLDEEKRAAVDLGELVAGLVAAAAARARKRGVQVRLAAAGRRLSVLASPDRLAQVIENLLDNAVSFSPQGGSVEVKVGGEAGEAWVRVEDEGPGIPPEHLERIFDRFFSYRPAESGARQHHAGLGLAIVKAIVEGYGGRIEAGNRPQGGACLTVQLPEGL